MIELADAEARHRIATEFATTFFVEAAAGTGKTTALVGRIIGLIRSGTTALERIVAVTFTEKAAGEMKLRLRSEIEKARARAEALERSRLDRALEELELARIGTIHAFCGDLLHERPVEARIDPLFGIASDVEAAALADQAFDAWFQRVLADPPEGVRRVLRRRGGSPPREQLRGAVHVLRDHRDFPHPWRRDPFDRNRRIDTLMDELAALGGLASKCDRGNDTLAKNLRDLHRFVSETTRLEKVESRDHDGLEAELRGLTRFYSWGWKGTKSTKFETFTRDEVLARRDALKADLDAFLAASDADLAPLIHQALAPAVADYEALKAKYGKLDFLDLLIKTRDLLRDDATVRKDFQKRFTHYFIDEVQDTDPLQVEIMLLLAAESPTENDWRRVCPSPGKLFLVGDPKQSLYRFRRADIAIYQDLKMRLMKIGASLLHLTTSFRSPPSIQALINGAFAPAMAAAEPGTQADYVALTPARPEPEGQPTIIALPVPCPYGDKGNITNTAIDASFPDAVAAFIDWLVSESGWTVEENRERVLIRPRHVAVLFRRFQNFGSDVTRPYVRGLEARRVPHVLVGGRSFHDREEVMALRNALVAVEWPDDELRVFATLRGPFFALADTALLAYRQYVADDGAIRTRRLDPLRSIERSSLPAEALEVADALDLLRSLHSGRNRRPISQTVAMFLEGVRAHAGIALWPTGEQALGNCQRMIDMARAFEGQASSFRAFVESLETDADSGQTSEAPIVEEGTEGVRLMTVHKAKGLEFPVVILADPTMKLARDKPSRHVDSERKLWLESICGCAPIELLEAEDEERARDRSEAMRVAYVAATRAQDLIVLPACGDRPIQGWLEALSPMIYPSSTSAGAVRQAAGCPQFGGDTVIDRGPNGMTSTEAVLPGAHRPQVDGPDVVWWSPAALHLDVPLQAPLRQQQILGIDPDGGAAAGQAKYEEWRSSHEATVQRASQARISFSTVTSSARSASNEHILSAVGQSKGGCDLAEPKISIQHIARPDTKAASGRRFGTLVHAILAVINFDADQRTVAEMSELYGRIIGATPHEIATAAKSVVTAFSHPIFRRAKNAATDGFLRREVPVVTRAFDGSLIEGIIDLAFQESTAGGQIWTVVDFKTDRDPIKAEATYERQVSLYCRAVTASTGLPCSGYVFAL